MQQRLTTDVQARAIIIRLYATTAIDEIIKRAKIGRQRYAVLVKELVSTGDIPKVKPKVCRKHVPGPERRQIGMTTLELYTLWTSSRSRAHKKRVMEQVGLRESAIQARIRKHIPSEEDAREPNPWLRCQWTDPAFVTDKRVLWG